MKTTTVIQVSAITHSKVKELANKERTFLSAILARIIICYFNQLEDITTSFSFFPSISKRKGVELDIKLGNHLKKKINQLNLTRDYKQRVTMIGLFDILVDKYYRENIQ